MSSLRRVSCCMVVDIQEDKWKMGGDTVACAFTAFIFARRFFCVTLLPWNDGLMKIFLCYIALFASMLTLPLAAASQRGGGTVFTLGRTAGGLEVSLELGGFGLEE